MCGVSVTKRYLHEIHLDGNTVCLDWKEVRIVADLNTRDLIIGCTKVSFAALRRIMELVEKCDFGNEKVLQEGRS